MEIKDILFSLCGANGLGSVNEASKTAQNILKEYCSVKTFKDSSFCGEFNFGKEKTLLLEAHIDEVGMIVTCVDDQGFVTAAACGGIDAKILPSVSVCIHGKQKVKGVFCSTPMHLSSKETAVKDISEIKIDTALKEKAKELISVGDIITYDSSPACLLGSRVVSKSLDNRAGCAVLLELAKRVSKKELPVNLVLLFSDSEELGLRGARTAAYNINADEAVAIDVSFALAPGLPAEKCGKLSQGAMIGISPFLSKTVTNKLLSLAKQKNIKYQYEVMGGSTGTDADVLSVIKEGIPCGLVSIPIRNMHSPAEVADINDMLSVADILEEYILCGGAL